jgi:hypothetical protein
MVPRWPGQRLGATSTGAARLGGQRPCVSHHAYGSRLNGMESLCPNGRSVWPFWS